MTDDVRVCSIPEPVMPERHDRTRPSWAQYQVDLPEGRSGSWRVERFTVGKADAAFGMMRAAFGGGRWVPEGTYTGLLRSGATIMSDTPDEIRDHMEPIRNATGRVLIGGLGLGMVTEACLKKPEVEHVLVIEQSPDVIGLVAPTYLGRYGAARLTVVQADLLTWKPPKGMRWDVAWWDIWDTISADNLKEMRALHRRFGRCVDWQGSWCRARCERAERAWKKERERLRWRW